MVTQALEGEPLRISLEYSGIGSKICTSIIPHMFAYYCPIRCFQSRGHLYALQRLADKLQGQLASAAGSAGISSGDSWNKQWVSWQWGLCLTSSLDELLEDELPLLLVLEEDDDSADGLTSVVGVC